MTKIGRVTSASMVALSLSGQARALEESVALPIRINCDDARLKPICDELALALLDAQSARRVEVVDDEKATGQAHLTVRFVPAHFTGTVVSGHLAWTDGEGATGLGTDIDLTVLDATIDDEILREYARQLIGFTEMPL